MAISDKLNRLETARDNIVTSLYNKGLNLAAEAGFEDFPNSIDALKPSSYVDTSEVTATASDVLASKKIVDASGNILTGTIATKTDSGNTSLNATTSTKSYAAGYYPNAHGATVATVTPPTPSITISTSGLVTASYIPGAGYNNSTSSKSRSVYLSSSYDSDFVASNIKSGVSIFGITGTYSGEIKTYSTTYSYLPGSVQLSLGLGGIKEPIALSLELKTVGASMSASYIATGLFYLNTTSNVILVFNPINNFTQTYWQAFSTSAIGFEIGETSCTMPILNNSLLEPYGIVFSGDYQLKVQGI